MSSHSAVCDCFASPLNLLYSQAVAINDAKFGVSHSNQVNAEDGFAILNLLNGTMHAMDSGNSEAFANLFSAEGTFDYPQRGVKRVGTTALYDLCEMLRIRLKGCFHEESNHCISYASQEAAEKLNTLARKEIAFNLSYFKTFKNGQLETIGKHEDTLRKLNGKWHLHYRKVTCLWDRDAPPPVPLEPTEENKKNHTSESNTAAK